MLIDRRSLVLGGTAALVAPAALSAVGAQPVARRPIPAEQQARWLDVRSFGARGDGTRIDTPAINDAIAAASRAGGGTVYFPAGTYACYTIRLRSNVTLYLEQGAVILAASTPPGGTTSGGYDAPDPVQAWDAFQDFGHTHWANSLIHGDGLHDVAILGAGILFGKGLSSGRSGRSARDNDNDLPVSGQPGVGDKTIALRNCRNVLLRDFKVRQGGWFALLATGVDNLTIDNLIVDTNRDGFDIDCCRNVRVSNCTVNSPWDDGICPKSSFALGYARSTENVTITNCHLTGVYQVGSIIDGTWKRMPMMPDRGGTGRIKCGTESNGGFKNITISNCVFEECQGIALETVDGAVLEDITITNITMRRLSSGPLFLRLGRRMRGPAGTPIGTLRRVLISNISSFDGPLLPSIIAGVADHPVEDVKIADLFVQQTGGAGADLVGREVPLLEDKYPEPGMFGPLPATGFFIRQARNIEMSNVEVSVAKFDPRPAFWLQDVDGADFFRVRAPKGETFMLDRVSAFRSFGSPSIADRKFSARVSRTF
ncbi:glycoside hydrolase family 28 protein [Sphingomonas sp. BIUV-7]|uniref:Glycoside hydrolase family 28 protein n=1 Tax=Sphingomonas natans TaxID=3063330 RepID=A0ABT8Y8H5_9SPHN|nr:glycoside hydrolase family 28 protein [Sphingomonas sp. BIUV-7]MDO6414636.1 glycoside hydrolase family 28 protein [Sphingomonas sp. BIUV-7]